jgi:hypothetical protein
MRNQRSTSASLLLAGVLVVAGCSGGDDDSDTGACVPTECARSCFDSGYAVGQCTAEGLCRCSGAHDADADADDADVRPDVEPDVAPDVEPDGSETLPDAPEARDEGWWSDEGWYESWVDDAPPPDYGYDVGYDVGYDSWYEDAGTPDWYPDDGYDSSRDDAGTPDWYPDYGYDVDYDDAGSAACRSWSSWVCMGGGGECYATCGGLTLECALGYCECSGSGTGVACPLPPGSACEICELALSMGCCPL